VNVFVYCVDLRLIFIAITIIIAIDYLSKEDKEDKQDKGMTSQSNFLIFIYQNMASKLRYKLFMLKSTIFWL
jgi:hypothetical protein